jgi:hypothetical protein
VRLAVAFGPLAAARSVARVNGCGMLLFVWALARTHWWQRIRGKFTRVAQPYIRADALKRAAQFHVGHRFEHDARFVLFAWLYCPLLALCGYRWRLGRWQCSLLWQTPTGAVCRCSRGRWRGRASGWAFVASSHALSNITIERTR